MVCTWFIFGLIVGPVIYDVTFGNYCIDHDLGRFKCFLFAISDCGVHSDRRTVFCILCRVFKQIKQRKNRIRMRCFSPGFNAVEYFYETYNVPVWSENAFLILQWHHNEHDCVSNHRRLHCLLKCWFGHRPKETSKHRVTDLFVWNPPVTGWFPAQGDSNAKMLTSSFINISDQCF